MIRARALVIIATFVVACDPPEPGPGGGDGGLPGACASDLDCGGATPVCANLWGAPACVQCASRADCPDGLACDAARGTCGCASDGDCGGTTPLCATDGTRTFCVECWEDAQCGGASCDPTDGRCR